MDGFVFWLNEVVAYALLYDPGSSDLPAPFSIATPSKHGGLGRISIKVSQN